MSILGSTFQIGRSALAAYQAAISVVGQNIANVGNPDYTRQTARLTPITGGPAGGLSPGIGVRMSSIERHVDEAVEARLRLSLSTKGSANSQYRTLAQVETLYNELTDKDLSTQLDGLFAAFAALQTTPTDMTSRNLLLSAAKSTAQTIQRQRAGLLSVATDLNKSVQQATDRASNLAGQIATLNGEIAQEEAGGQSSASALRDRRDALLRELSGLMEIQTREQPNGAVNVYVGSEPLVDFDRSRGLKTELVLDDGIERAQVRFADNNGPVALRDGELAGLVTARDVHLAAQIERLDALAKGLIYEVNRIHSSGRGLVGQSDLQGTYDVRDANAALNTAAAGLDYPVQNGSLIVHVRDTQTGRVITRQIEVDLDGLNGNDTTLASLAASLGGVPGLSASVTTDNRLQITAAPGSEFWITEDTSGAMAALGVGTFFQGHDASDIAVRDEVAADVRLISASLNGEPGDGANAGRLATVGESASSLLGNQGVLDFHTQTVGQLAVATSTAANDAEAADTVYSGLVAQREAVSGVSTDEEALNLSKFEKAYQGAARYLNVINQLADEMLSLVQ